jgi:hypothetical protein
MLGRNIAQTAGGLLTVEVRVRYEGRSRGV